MINDQVIAICAEIGMPFAPPKVLSNSRLAIEAAEFARDAGRLEEFHWAMLTAFFVDSQDLGDVAVLKRLAEEVGLDAAALERALDAGTYADRREAAFKEAEANNISRVPTFIFPDGRRIEGGSELGSLRSFLGG